jgi:hypothetical protein
LENIDPVEEIDFRNDDPIRTLRKWEVGDIIKEG